MSSAGASKRARALAASFQRLGERDRVRLQRLLGQAAVAQASLGVRAGRDPYGRAWAPLTSRTGRPLRRTGSGIQRAWASGRETKVSFVLGSRARYLATHQYGARIRPRRCRVLSFRTERWGLVRARMVVIPRRQLVPEQSTGGLGVRWLAAFERAVHRLLTELFSAKAV